MVVILCAMPPALEIRGSATGLLDDPLVLHARGADGEPVMWRARLRDDDGRVWKASAARAEDLAAAWAPAKATSGQLPALQSLRPVRLDLRVEADDGRAGTRALTRLLVADGVRIRRWRDGLPAALHLPADSPCAAVLIDATGDPVRAAVAALAAPLLASRGALTLVVAQSHGDPTLALAAERLASVPSAEGLGLVPLPVLDPRDEAAAVAGVVAPPGVGVHGESADAAAARAAAWDALLAALGARPREKG